MTPLRDHLPSRSVTNVAVFISDSLRYDHLPEEIRKRGLTARAISPSTFTASSVPSMFSGCYPSEHGVYSFNHSLPREPSVFKDVESSIKMDTIWTDIEPERKPPLRVLKTTPGRPLSTLESPFLYVEHDKGGHSPYGFSFDECASTPELYEKHVDSPDEIPPLYRRSVKRSSERFLTLLERFEDRGVLDETLVIFVSDHGEALGEAQYGGGFEHGPLVSPPLVSVPMVFFGAGLPKGEHIDTLLSGTDLGPTILGAQGRPIPQKMSGVDLWNETPSANRVIRSEFRTARTINGTERVVYGATSVWNEGGGVVKHTGNRLLRLAFAHKYHYKDAPFSRITRRAWKPRNEIGILRTYGPKIVHYGDGAQSVSKHTIRQLPDELVAQSGISDDVIDREQLEKLGYLE